MVEKFEKGKRYRFVKEIAFENVKTFKNNYVNMPMVKYWVDLIDSQEVEILNEHEGQIDTYIVEPKWCEEII